MNCPKCGKNPDNGGRFCAQCGAEVSPVKGAGRGRQIGLLAVAALLIIGLGIYIWIMNISNGEKLAMEKYLPNKGKVESRLYANIRNERYKDVVVLTTSEDKPQQQYITVISFNAGKRDWEVIFEKAVPRFGKSKLEICKLLPGDKEQILVRYNGGGTGGFLDYSILGWNKDEMQVYLNREMLPMGKVEVQGNQLFEASSAGNRIYKWSENAFIATALVGDSVKPVGSDDVVVTYKIIDDKTVYVSQKEITMYVGQQLSFVCDSPRRAARIMYSGNVWEFKDGVSIAKEPTDTTVQILPTYGGWEDAAKVHVVIKNR